MVSSEFHCIEKNASDVVRFLIEETHIWKLTGPWQLSKRKYWTLWLEADFEAEVFQQLKDEVSFHLIVLAKVITIAR